MKKNHNPSRLLLNPSPLLLAALLTACLAGPARAQFTHAFNSGMNCYGVYTLPDTSTRPYHSGIAGDDATYQPAISSPSYTNNGDGTVTDNVTGLMWVRSSGSATYAWVNALSSCAVTMNSPGFAGYTDWRLPNVLELMSIVDYGAANAPFISQSSFPDTVSGRYWTSTTYITNITLAWVVNFNTGAAYNGLSKATNYPVRCVRGGP